MDIETNKVVLTEDAIDWVVRRGRPVCATDFIGYLFELKYLYKSMRKLGGALDVFGGFMLYSLDEKNPSLTDKKAIKIYKKLIKLGFLKVQEESPFEEFESFNVPMDSEKTIFAEQPMFLSVARQRRFSGYGNGLIFS